MVSKLREGALSPTGRKFADTVHSKIEELRKELLLGVVKENVSMFRITVGREGTIRIAYSEEKRVLFREFFESLEDFKYSYKKLGNFSELLKYIVNGFVESERLVNQNGRPTVTSYEVKILFKEDYKLTTWVNPEVVQ